MKNTVISTVSKWILFLGGTFPGHNHDYTMLKEEFTPKHPWFKTITTFGDLGYHGIQKDYDGDRINIPQKKPRKSKKNSKPELTAEQKTDNYVLSKVRILVENAIAGIKRYNILVYSFRNRKAGMDDKAIALAAGLWNFLLV